MYTRLLCLHLTTEKFPEIQGRRPYRCNLLDWLFPRERKINLALNVGIEAIFFTCLLPFSHRLKVCSTRWRQDPRSAFPVWYDIQPRHEPLQRMHGGGFFGGFFILTEFTNTSLQISNSKHLLYKLCTNENIPFTFHLPSNTLQISC